MTIRKGTDWTRPGSLPDDGVRVHTDAAAADAVVPALDAGREPPVLGLLGGDLCRTVGGTGDEARLVAGGRTFELDAVSVELDGEAHWFVAHLVARRRLWRGRVVAAMNAEWLGRWDVAPRSHPSDGRIEVFDARLPRGDKLEAARRLRTGSHLPHPNIAVSVVKRWETQLDPGTKVWLDGRCVGAARTLRIVVHPDAISAVV